jgi:hypothetical protein
MLISGMHVATSVGKRVSLLEHIQARAMLSLALWSGRD